MKRICVDCGVVEKLDRFSLQCNSCSERENEYQYWQETLGGVLNCERNIEPAEQVYEGELKQFAALATIIER